MIRFNLLLLSGCLLVILGCKSAPKTGSTWLASVVITNKTSSQIRVTAVEVFQQDGYTVKSLQGNEVVFEKPGTKTQNVLYGGLSSGIWMRVKLRVRDYGLDARLLECNAYRVEDKDDRALETEKPISRGGTFQKLLDEVKIRLH